MDAANRHSRIVGADHRLSVSFEFFPPKTEQMEETLWHSIERLAPLAPSFVSVTYGAGGSTRERTHGTVKRILTETQLTPAAHLTCVGASRTEIDAIVDSYAAIGVRHIVALRGDPVAGVGTPYIPHPEGYSHAADLIAGIKRRHPGMEISASAYVERHPESRDWAVELDNIKRKVDAGADRLITQFFFDNDLYDSYLERVRAAGIDVPVVPGLIPVLNFTQTAKFAAKAGASVPPWFAARFEGLEDDPTTRQLVAAAVAAEQALDLVDRGVTRLHFTTMNRADLVYAVCYLLGLRPTRSVAAGEAAA
ncbi:MAG TPA: methylenetetrahydrofolate reductase [NAD(P)H] [Bauldia sp.]|nr:methylenetetrahydrofolate reductase [NAD(P)H] [Bauldia sp.]